MSHPTSRLPLFRHGQPAYAHDCPDCRFLGTVDRLDSLQIPDDVADVDLYAHVDPRAGSATDVVARYGNEPNQVVRGQDQSAFTALHSPEPHLAAAAGRSIQLGLLRVGA